MTKMVKTSLYYSPSWQYGNGLTSFRGPVMQKGYGLGGFFKGLARSFAPVLKKGLLTVGKKAVKTGIQIMQDTSQGKSLKESIKQRAKQNTKEAIQEGFSTISQHVQDKRTSRKRAIKGNTPKRAKKIKSDIFD